MTVSYQYDVASSASGGFIRLLFRWRGSVWKVVYREMLIFSVCYISLTVLYNFLLTEAQQRIFEQVVFFCSTFMDLIPLSFMLGFYVSFIAARWWSQFIAIPWPDKLMNIVAMYIPGFDESSRVVRRTLMRYLNLSLVLVLRSISMAVKRRFPTKEHLIEAGFMTKTELEMFQSVPSTEFNTFWIPCTWFINVLREARQDCRITDSNGLKLIMEELNEFRSKCGLLWGYDWISIPLVYTQVVTMATYAFYVACMFGRQNVNIINDKPASPEVHRYDYYVPVFTILQLMFYMGLLKVAEQLINPFGDDDEDFELNWIIDRHMKVSYLGVDTLNGTPPPLVKDTYYNELDVKIPYTEASKSYKKKTYRGSVAYMQVPMEQQHMVVPDMSEEEDDGETATDSMGVRRPSMYSLFQARGSKGISPAGSFTNLDTRSLEDSDLNLAKNASGTLGLNQDLSVVVDMAKAEDDEIVLQEVIVDNQVQQQQRPLPVVRSNSLQIPGSKAPGVSPKIAPKFPREKLKSMFRKKKLPLHRLKGVHFSRDTKDSDDSESESLLNEVELTLSTPELTDAERETGVHPYYFTQQTMTARQLVTGRAFSVRLARTGSEEDRVSKGHQVQRAVSRSSSLPDIRQVRDHPVVASSLKKISKVKEKARRSSDQKQPEADSPRRNTLPQITLTRFDRKGSEHLDLATSSHSSSQSSDSGRQESDANLPKAPPPPTATVTKPPAIQKPPPKVSSVPTRRVSPPKPVESSHSKPRKPSPQSSISSPEETRRDSLTGPPKAKAKPPETRRVSPPKPVESSHSKPRKPSPQSSKSSPEETRRDSLTGPPKAKAKPPETIKPPVGPKPGEKEQQHSKPSQRRPPPPSLDSSKSSDPPKLPPPPEPSKAVLEKHSKKPEHSAVKFVADDESPRKTSQPRKRSPPPLRRSSLSPNRPTSLLFYSKRGSVSSKKIAGIALAPDIPTSPDSSYPSSPVYDIPSPPELERAPTFPRASQSPEKARVKETVVTIFGSQEDLPEASSTQPCPVPQRRKTRPGAKGKK